MSEWLTPAEILPFAGTALPATMSGLQEHILREGWRQDRARSRRRDGQGGGYEYHVSLLPDAVRSRLAALDDETAPVIEAASADVRSPLWASFEALPAKVRARAAERHAAVLFVHRAEGPRQAAVRLAATEFGVSASSLWGWLRLVEGVAISDWLPTLAPRHHGGRGNCDVDPNAWDYFKADYLCPAQRGYAACYDRLQRAAREHGWAPIPSLKTLQRKLERETPRAVMTLARQGRDAAARMMPHQRRDRTVFAALEAVNADGYKHNVFVRWPDGTIGRPISIVFQDVRSGLWLARRTDKSENKEAVRLAIADMISRYGIPEHAYFDNGRHFASKWLTGRMAFRFRFKVRDEEPEGILTTLGVKVHFTTPYRGQSKPIERSFRDIGEYIDKHPRFAGAWTGASPMAKPEDYGSKAIPLDEFERVCASEIAHHNAKPGRRGFGMNGRSFEQVFAETMPELGLRRASVEQQRLFLLAAEGVTARAPNGEIHLFDNRFWAEALTNHIGQRLVVRFDPQNMHAGITVYTLDNRLICEAERLDDIGFNSATDAQEASRLTRGIARNRREFLDLNRRLDAADLARLTPVHDVDMAPEPAGKVTRMVANGRPRISHEMDFDALGAGLDRIADITSLKARDGA
jgi:hypothetical protein